MAVYPVAPGAPDYSTGSAGASGYIPAIYSALLIKKFYPKTVFTKIANTDYEGDIKSQGDTVYIRTRPTIDTFRYKKGMVLPVQNPESPYVTLKIDQGEGFSFAIDKVDEFQSDIKLMSIWGEDAAEQMRQRVDKNGLISIAAQGAVAGGKTAATIVGYDANYGPSLSEFTAAKGAMVATGVTAKGTVLPTSTTAGAGFGLSDAAVSCTATSDLVKQILMYARVMDEANAPEDGRFVILPYWCSEKMKDISSPFGQAYATGQNMANALSGTTPKIDRFEVIFSNNLPGSTQAVNGATAVIFGTRYATTFATQITESRIIQNPFSFGQMMQALQVYGFNIIKPTMLGVDFIKNA